MGYWTKETFVEEIKRLESLDISLSAGNIAFFDPSLYQTGITYFGTWREVLAAAGIDYAGEVREPLRE